ncbi:MAG: PilW family protein, partial [Janthinobacterium lividum]
GVALLPAGDPNTDTLLVMYGNSSGGPQGDMVLSQDATAQTYAPRTPTAYAPNDQVIATERLRPDPCTYASGNYLRVETVGSATPANAPSTLNMTTKTSTGNSKVNGALFNIGQAPVFAAYAIRKGNLTVCDFAQRDCSNAGKKDDSTFWTTLANNIVSLRAQYGHDTATVASAAPADGSTYAVNMFDQVTPATACAWMRTLALRLVLVARSGQYDKEAVTTAAPGWSGSVAGSAAGSTAAPLDLSRNPDGSTNADWQHYRYKTFQSVVPLRNITWLGVQPSC